MKLVIEIDEKKYEEIKRIAKAQFDLTDKTEAQIIANGTPVSNEGDLISRSELKKAIDDYAEKRQDTLLWQADIEEIIDNEPTVEERSYEQGVIDGRDTEFDNGFEQGYAKGYENCEHDNERPQGEWIPVSERLPEEKWFNPTGSDFGFDFEEVLCTTIWGDVRPYKYGKPKGHDRPHFWLGGGIMDEYVIAWQYKPEPYKEGGAEE